MGVWSRLAAAAAASRPDRWRGLAGLDVTELTFVPVGSRTAPLEHAGADDSQQTIDWLAELRAAGACVPAWAGEHDPDVGRMTHAIDEAVRAFRARLEEAVVELCGQVPASGRQREQHRRVEEAGRPQLRIDRLDDSAFANRDGTQAGDK
jgi:hypothetical protein